MRTIQTLLTALSLLLLSQRTTAQNKEPDATERKRPAEWAQLVTGARFRDRFLPMQGRELTSKTWGSPGVCPRFVDNGIEDAHWSYWGGNIKKDKDGKYHLFVCGWPEATPKGHAEWPRSLVFNAIGVNLEGPYKPLKIIGSGHNPEIYQIKDGRWVLYVIDGRYVSKNLNGPWEFGTFDFDQRDRRIIEGLSNLTFAQREDSSYLMVCRGGGIWISQDGLSPYSQVSDKSVYPPVEGRFEDPVIWRDHIQYHLIVNDWFGRIAYYLRSKDGVNWVVDPGEAYTPGIAVHADGRIEEWFKFERLKIYQDPYGRAIQANFAVIDTVKPADKGFDNHSSKNITIPLNPGLLLAVLDQKPISDKTKTIRVRIQAETGFNPQTDVDLPSLRFGASEEVNFGRGGSVLKVENEGNDLIVTFNGKESGIKPTEFAPKLIGKDKNGKLLFGYARLPYVNYLEPILSAKAPQFSNAASGLIGSVEIQNFGQVASQKASLKVTQKMDGKETLVAIGIVPALTPYEKKVIQLSGNPSFVKGKEYTFVITIHHGDRVLSSFSVKKKVLD